MSVDAPSVSLDVVERLALPFDILCDVDAAVVRQFGLLHTGGNPHGGDTTVPAMFLIGSEGKVLWRRVAQRIQDRPDPREILDAIERLAAAP
ncbi:MAG: hypothetical protein FLDDKLPJ_00856 [Phycisphaerae bacterium]|nr:hypothetical protein [Phycisphaerae bacterium]